MSNQTAFEVRISRAAIKRLLNASKAEYIIIEGKYKYKGKVKGIHLWEMAAIAKMKDADQITEERCCPMPCGDPISDS